MKFISKKSAAIFLFFTVLISALIISAFVCYADAYYTVKVEYRFNDGTVAHDPYVAALPAGSEVDLNVKNPILPGYKPVESLEPDAEEKSSTVIHYDSLTEDETIIVYFIPDLVHYKVRYFMQNIRDDLYTENLSLANSYYEKSGYTGSFPEGLQEQEFDGFTSLFHEPDTIAADGSTVFKVYYDRNYYLVDFLLGEGGYGVEPVYAKHGTTYQIATPKRAGYTFLGWVRSNRNGDYLDNSGNTITEEAARAIADPFDSGVVPIGDSYYRAVWQPEEAKFSVVYWTENSADDGYSVVVSKDIHQIVVNNVLTDVKADMLITPDTYVKNAAGTKNVKLKDFFEFNLNYADPDDARNSDPETTVRYDTDGNIIDFNEISKGVTEEYKDAVRFFELNTTGDTYVTDVSKTVAGDGTMSFNIFFKRRPFTLKFFYARRKLVNGQPTGAIDLTNSTKNFSNQSYTGTNYMTAVARGTWQSDIADTLPTLKQEYVDAGYISELYQDYSGYRYYYYQVSSKYNAPLKNKWFVDSVNPVHKKNYAEEQMCIPGSWAVENGTYYYNSHTTVKNYTIKGIYEKLGIELMFQSRTSDYTELHYLVSWTNTSTTKNWNYGIDRVLRFKYRNYVELTSYERHLLRDDFGMDEDDPDRDIPSDRVFDPTKNDYIKEPATGQYIDLEIVRDNYLVSGEDAIYSEIVKFNTSSDPNAQPKLYGLKNVFEEVDSEVFDVDTVDSGDQYDRTKTEAVRTANVRTNQTPTDLTGFQIENYRLNPTTHQIVLDSTNTTVDWSEDTDTERHATIRFFYRRRTYNLSFRNGSDVEDESFTIPYGEYINYTTAPQRLLIPSYYNADLRSYYSFNGWYFDPIFSDAQATAGFAMPADDITLYAKWTPVSCSLSFYNDYGDYSDSEAAPVHTCSVPYNTKVLTSDVPVDEEHASLRIYPPNGNTHAHFAGWYYLDKEGNPARFDPENLPVTRELELYADWVSEDTAKYRVKYVEKGTNNEVAPAETGTVFVSKTRTFTAKSGDKLNEDHRWVENQPNWWPTVSSHSILIADNSDGEEYAPNEFTFEYILKTTPVNYAVQFLDAETNQPVSTTLSKTTYYAAVTEVAPYIEGYVADSVTKSRVLSASEKTGAAAMEEELRNNVITFFYTPSDTSAVYQVSHYIQNTDCDGYEFYNSETLYGTISDSVTISSIENGEIASALTSSGFTFMSAMATVSVDGAAAVPTGASVTLTGAPTEISVYYNRNTYGYTVKYVDYEQEKLYDDDDTLWNGELYSVTYTGADKQPVGTDVSISVPSDYTYTHNGESDNYTRISDRQLVLTIRKDNPDNPAVNIIKVYYKKDKERELNYRVVCDTQTSDRYAVLSQSTEIVENLAGIRGSTVTPLELADHEYEFLGWFSTPSADEGNRLTDALTLSYAPSVLPGADMTYYAVFHQKKVYADVEIRYNDTGVYTNDAGAAEDSDGSVTGYTVEFDDPDGYVNNSETALDKTGEFGFEITKSDSAAYKYEFAGWYEVNTANGNVTARGTESSLSLTRNSSYRYIAMFRKKTSLNYEIKYRFTTRSYGVKDYTLKGTFSSSAEISAALNESASCELSDDYILTHAPYESNHGEHLSWPTSGITRSSSEATNTVSAVITAAQSVKTVYVHYKLLPSDSFELIETTLGANRETDSSLEVMNAESVQYDGKEFSYWEIRKTADGDVIARCYDAWFTFCIMDNYWITPVYNGEKSPESDPDFTGIKLSHLDYTRNRWNTEDDEGEIVENGNTDLLYTDFEISFNNKNKNLSGYRAGIAVEICTKLPDDRTFNSERDYGFVSDETNLKAAILDGTVKKYKYSGDKERSIQFVNVPNKLLTNKNRVEVGKGYKNTGDAKSYILKATAYLIDNENNVTLSNSVYVCLKGVAAQNLALGGVS